MFSISCKILQWKLVAVNFLIRKFLIRQFYWGFWRSSSFQRKFSGRGFLIRTCLEPIEFLLEISYYEVHRGTLWRFKPKIPLKLSRDQLRNILSVSSSVEPIRSSSSITKWIKRAPKRMRKIEIHWETCGRSSLRERRTENSRWKRQENDTHWLINLDSNWSMLEIFEIFRWTLLNIRN